MSKSMAVETCPICSGTGFKTLERDGLLGAEICECALNERARGALVRANIPPLYQNASLENFVVPQDNPLARTGLGMVLMQVRSFVREFPASDHPGLLLIGSPGTGKTHLAVAALRALIGRGYEGVFFDYQNLLDRIRSSYDQASGSSDREAYRTALDAEILLLDDLGAQRVTEWTEDTVTSLITYRCNHRKPLIATTNLPDSDATGKVIDYTGPGGTPVYKRMLADIVGVRVRSRLFEMCRVVRMPEVEDFRIRKAR